MNTIKINPIPLGLPAEVATRLMVRAIILSTRDTSCYTYYEVSTEQGKVLAKGECSITEEQYALWGSDNTYIEDIVISNLGLERDITVPVEETQVNENPVEETLVEETQVNENPVEETPVEETQVNENPVEEIPVEETPVEETPVEETPVNENPVE